MMPENQRFLNIAMQKNKYEKSLSEQVQARYDFLFRSKVLDFYNGKPLAF